MRWLCEEFYDRCRYNCLQSWLYVRRLLCGGGNHVCLRDAETGGTCLLPTEKIRQPENLAKLQVGDHVKVNRDLLMDPSGITRAKSEEAVSVLGFGSLPPSVMFYALITFAFSTLLVNYYRHFGIQAWSPAIVAVTIIGFGVGRCTAVLKTEAVIPGNDLAKFLDSSDGVRLQSVLQSSKAMFDPEGAVFWNDKGDDWCRLDFSDFMSASHAMKFASWFGRMVLNTVGLFSSFIGLFASTRAAQWSMMSIVQALDSLILVHLIAGIMSHLWQHSVGQVVILAQRSAGLSSLAFLRNLSTQQAMASVSHYVMLTESYSMKGSWRVVYLTLNGALGALGLLALLEKLSNLHVDRLKANMIEVAATRDLQSLDWTHMLRFAVLVNQIVSAAPLEEFEFQRLLYLVFARDGVLDESSQQLLFRYSQALYATLWTVLKQASWKKVYVLVTFGPADLVRLIFRPVDLDSSSKFYSAPQLPLKEETVSSPYWARALGSKSSAVSSMAMRVT